MNTRNKQSLHVTNMDEEYLGLRDDPAHWYILHTRNGCGCERTKPNDKCDIGVALWNLTIKMEAA